MITTTAMKDRGKFAENLPMRTITLQGGLCFWCNERYSTGHRCKNHDQRELRVLVVMDGVNDLEVVENDDNQEEQAELLMIKAMIKFKR